MATLVGLVLFAVLNITYPAPYVGPDCASPLAAKCIRGDGGAGGGEGNGNGK